MAVGDIISVTIVGGTVVSDSGFAPRLNGACAIVRIEGMGRRHPINDPVAVVSSLQLTVQDPGFDAVETPVTRTRTVRGTLPLRNTWPAAWAAATVVPARSWISRNLNQYYTEAGGTTGATAPTHTSGSVSDGGVTWTFQSAATVSGYIEKTVSGNVDIYIMLDEPIYQGSTITAASFGAGGYTVSGVSNLAAASIPIIVNGSTLQYEIPAVTYLTPPHLRSTGTFTPELVIGHGWMGKIPGTVGPVAGARFTAWDSGRTQSAQASANSSSLSTLVTASSPGGAAVEVYSASINTSGIGTGDAFTEVEVYPWLGLKWSSQIDGEGANWQGSRSYPYAGIIARNGSNFYIVTTPGVSASSGGPTGTGTAISDGTVVWNFFGSNDTKQNSHNIPARHHFYNDPTNAYVVRHAHVNSTGANQGTPLATHATYDASRAAFLAGNSFGTIQLAAAALQAATGRGDAGGCTIWLTNNTTGHSGFGASLSALAIGSEWLYCRADPAVSNVLFLAGANKVCHRRFWFGSGITTSATATGLGNCMLDPASDSTSTPAQPVTEVVFAGNTVNAFDGTQEVVNRVGATWYYNNLCTVGFQTGGSATRAHPVVLAGNHFSGVLILRGMAMFGNRVIGSANVGSSAVQDARAMGKPAGMFLMLADNWFQGIPAADGVLVNLYTGAANTDWARLGGYLGGNLFESCAAGANIEKTLQIAADSSTQGVSWIDAQGVTRGGLTEAYNSYVGQRRNGPYNDPATTYSAQWHAVGNLSLTDNMVEGADDHAGSGRSGARCQNWWSDYRVGYCNNVNFAGTESGSAFGPGTFAGQRAGVASKWNVVPVLANVPAQFVDDRSSLGTETGGGDYRPAPGAQALGVSTIPGRRFSRNGATRQINGAAGALETLSVSIAANGGVLALIGSAGSVTLNTGADYTPSVERLGRVGVALKPPAAVLDYPIAWALDTGETISASAWAVTPAGGMAVVAGSGLIEGAVTACLVSGGVYRRVYSLMNTITTSEGRTLAKTITVRIGPVEA